MKYHMDIDRNTTTLLYYLWYAWKMEHASRAICFLRMLRFYLCPILCTFIIILIIEFVSRRGVRVNNLAGHQ